MANQEKKVEDPQKERKVKDSELKSMFDYCNSVNSTAFVTDYTLQELNARPNWDLHLKRKIEYIRSFVDLIETKLNSRYSKVLGQKIELKDNIHFCADPRLPSVLTKLEIFKTGNSGINK